MKDTSNALTPEQALETLRNFITIFGHQQYPTSLQANALRSLDTLEAVLKERDERIAELERDNNDMTALESQVERAERAEAEVEWLEERNRLVEEQADRYAADVVRLREEVLSLQCPPGRSSSAGRARPS